MTAEEIEKVQEFLKKEGLDGDNMVASLMNTTTVSDFCNEHAGKCYMHINLNNTIIILYKCYNDIHVDINYPNGYIDVDIYTIQAGDDYIYYNVQKAVTKSEIDTNDFEVTSEITEENFTSIIEDISKLNDTAKQLIEKITN